MKKHGNDLYAGYATDRENRIWTYLPHGPYDRLEDYFERARTAYLGDGPLVHAIVDLPSGQALGQAGYMNIDSASGCIKVGGIIYAPALQRTRTATEAMFPMMRRVFEELGYRRYAWQCNALNAPSRAAATRLGFTLEGIFRQASVSKGRNRDTACFSILDHEWPAQRAAFERWLDPANFDRAGRQRTSLSEIKRQDRIAGLHRYIDARGRSSAVGANSSAYLQSPHEREILSTRAEAGRLPGIARPRPAPRLTSATKDTSRQMICESLVLLTQLSRPSDCQGSDSPRG